MSPAERIWAYSEVQANGCWKWQRSGSPEGYGQTTLGGRQMGAHRASYLVYVGPIPDGMTVDHTCFNPSCVNPAHLRLLTRQENARAKDPNKTPPWAVVWDRPRGPRRPLSDVVLPADAPVIDFEGVA
jgi:hypothetical protein